MNRYQLAVEAIDREHRLRMKIYSWLGATSLALVVLWSSGVRPFEWFAGTVPPPPPDKQSAAIAPPTSSAPSEPIALHREPLPGLDSSVSSQAQPLHLVATSPGRNAREGTARIGTHVENPQTYSVGAVLANGARLLEIHIDHVVLERNGMQAKLYSQNVGKKSASPLFMVGGEPERQVAVESYRETLTDYIRPNPVYDGVTLRGYEVYAGSRSEVFYQLGLQNGDVILSLNGQPFVEAKQAIEAMQQLTMGTTMSATIERHGMTERISLDGRVTTQNQKGAGAGASVQQTGFALVPRS